jgi:hypothetical protein
MRGPVTHAGFFIVAYQIKKRDDVPVKVCLIGTCSHFGLDSAIQSNGSCVSGALKYLFPVFHSVGISSKV